jgi:hypothetical protein
MFSIYFLLTTVSMDDIYELFKQIKNLWINNNLLQKIPVKEIENNALTYI